MKGNKNKRDLWIDETITNLFKLLDLKNSITQNAIMIYENLVASLTKEEMKKYKEKLDKLEKLIYGNKEPLKGYA